MGNYESKRRTKPCAACKRQKLKCIYTTSLPCERCSKQGIECSYPVTSPKVSMIKKRPIAVRRDYTRTRLPPEDVPGYQSIEFNPALSATQNMLNPIVSLAKPTDVGEAESDISWGQTVDQRLNALQNALNSALTVLQNTRVETAQQMNMLQTQLQGLQHEQNVSSNNNTNSTISLPSLREIISQDDTRMSITDFRVNKIISVDEAGELLRIFIDKMSAHMFGYNIEELSSVNLWNRSPLLLVSICAVACPHHPTLAFKQQQLLKSLKWFASDLVNNSESITSPDEVEYTILALIIASLWFEANHLYLSIALHLGRVWKIDEEHIEGGNELWKLWYLLYIADGAQNLISQKSPSLYKQSEPIILSNRRHLIEHIKNPRLKKVLEENDNLGRDAIATTKQLSLLNEVERKKIFVDQSQLQDMRLCGLVEYNMAIESIFHNKNGINSPLNAASHFLKPSKFGIPWESNMDLDKWMVSWTITLQNIDVGNDAWCLKSTLLYYNFARMHINTRWLSDRSTSLLRGPHKKTNWSEIWKSIEDIEPSKLKNASCEISMSAASALLKLATKDKDITSLFQFLPNHVYLMLFYASIIVLQPPTPSDITETSYLVKIQKNFSLVKAFRQMLASGTSSDLEFKRKIIDGIDELIKAFVNRCFTVSKIQGLKVIEYLQNSTEELTKGPKTKTISAWPSINHGHP